MVRPPPLVAICDISGSMSNYSRIFLHFLHALLRVTLGVGLGGAALFQQVLDLPEAQSKEWLKQFSLQKRRCEDTSRI